MGWFKKKEKKYPIEIEGAYVAKGLGVPAGTPCRLSVTEEAVSIICDDLEFVLQISNITNYQYEMNVITGTDVEPGSIWEGMVGESYYGLPGAIAGTLPKIKETRQVIGTTMMRYQGKTGKQTIVLIDHPNSACCAILTDEVRPKITIVEEEPELKRIEL